MKRITIILGLLLMFNHIKAQESKTIMDLFNNEKEEIKVGWFVQPEYRNFFNSDDFDNEHSNIVGGKIGLLINQSFYVGLSGYTKTNKLRLKTDESTIGIGYGYGGVYVGKSFFKSSILNPKLALSLGYGGASEYVVHNYYKGANHVAGFVFAEPEVSFDLNISQHLKLNLGLSYRFINMSNFELISTGDLDGLSVNIGFIIGSL